MQRFRPLLLPLLLLLLLLSMFVSCSQLRQRGWTATAYICACIVMHIGGRLDHGCSGWLVLLPSVQAVLGRRRYLGQWWSGTDIGHLLSLENAVAVGVTGIRPLRCRVVSFSRLLVRFLPAELALTTMAI